tara:strand:+ start:83 stop:508 length:426 start_codon:yes stop_codon:yes gene_type:complete
VSSDFASEMLAEHYDAVSALWQATEGLGDTETREEFCRYLSRNPGISSVVSHDGRIIGALLGGHDGRRGYLYHLAVAADHRGAGVATALIGRCLDQLQRLQIQRCSLHVYRANATAVEFWSHQQWRERCDLKLFAVDLPRR